MTERGQDGKWGPVQQLNCVTVAGGFKGPLSVKRGATGSSEASITTLPRLHGRA